MLKILFYIEIQVYHYGFYRLVVPGVIAIHFSSGIYDNDRVHISYIWFIVSIGRVLRLFFTLVFFSVILKKTHGAAQWPF